MSCNLFAIYHLLYYVAAIFLILPRDRPGVGNKTKRYASAFLPSARMTRSKPVQSLVYVKT